MQTVYRRDDVQELFCHRQLANLINVRGICLWNTLLQPFCNRLIGTKLFSWLRGSVDFDSKYKILMDETRAHGVPIHEDEKKFKTRIYTIILKLPPPKISD